MMKKMTACFFVLILLWGAGLEAKTKLTDEEAKKELLQRIDKEKRYGTQVNQSCLSVFQEGSDAKHYGFSVHVNQGGNCPGNPNASPVIEYFQVNRATGKIEIKNPRTGRSAVLPNQAKAKKK
jgi:hypothetical protein